MPKATTQPPAVEAASTSIAYPPEILAIKAAREKVLSHQAIIADNAALHDEQSRTLANKLFHTDLRDTKAAGDLAMFKLQADLSAHRGLLLVDEMESLLADLRAQNMRAHALVRRDAGIVAEGRARDEWSIKREKLRISFGSEARHAQDFANIQNFHGHLVTDVEKIGWDQPWKEALEISRQILNAVREIYEELPQHQAAVPAL